MLWKNDVLWSLSHQQELNGAIDINHLRENVEALNAPYLEVQFNQRVEQAKQRWPLLVFNLNTLNRYNNTSSNELSEDG